MTNTINYLESFTLQFWLEHILPFFQGHPEIIHASILLVTLRIGVWVVVATCFKRQKNGWPSWPRVLTSRFSGKSILVQIPRILTPERLAITMIPFGLIKMLSAVAFCILLASFFPEPPEWRLLFHGYRWPLLSFILGVAITEKFLLVSIARFLLSGRVDVLIRERKVTALRYLLGIPIPNTYRWDPSIHTISSHNEPHAQAADQETSIYRDAHIVYLLVGAACIRVATVIGRQEAAQISYIFSSPIRDLLQKHNAGIDRAKIVGTALDYGNQVQHAE